jgi:hypothetical protein
MPLEETGAPRRERVQPEETEPREIHAQDPESGLIYIYDPATHTVTAYDPASHRTRTVTSEEELTKARRLLQGRPN